MLDGKQYWKTNVYEELQTQMLERGHHKPWKNLKLYAIQKFISGDQNWKHIVLCINTPWREWIDRQTDGLKNDYNTRSAQSQWKGN